jgi:hypothetical protein
MFARFFFHASRMTLSHSHESGNPVPCSAEFTAAPLSLARRPCNASIAAGELGASGQELEQWQCRYALTRQNPLKQDFLIAFSTATEYPPTILTRILWYDTQDVTLGSLLES